MATSTFNARVRMKRDTSANWTSNNPILLDGEIIVVDTTSGDVRFKVGDGTSRYTALPFLDEGWDIPSPSSTTPSMDGTAAIGTGTTYARADHVHPTDTSRAAAVHTHTASDITSGLAAVATSGSYNDLSDKPSVTNADWEEDDTEAASYVENRPAIRAGEGEDSIVDGQITDISNSAIYTLTVSGDAYATTFSYTTEDTLPSAAMLKNFGLVYYEAGISAHAKFHTIIDIDTTENTIELNSPLGNATTNMTLIVYYNKMNSASGLYSQADGRSTIAYGASSHAEGRSTVAGGSTSHAEGVGTLATGVGTHAEGGYTVASGLYTHTEGSRTRASNSYSHAEGLGTISGGVASHAQGQYNIEDTSNLYAHIVGNGTSDAARSNAYTLDWSGNGVYSGKLTVGSGPTANMDVATKQYVDENSGGDTILRTWVAGTVVSS